MVRRQFLRQGVLSKTVNLGEQVVHYYEYVPKRFEETVVLIHGLGTSSSTWVNILPHLGNFRVLAPDLPGFGFSPAPPGVPTLKHYAQFVKQFVDHIGLRTFTLLGHSMGGWITMRYTLAHRDRVHHLILINTAGIYYQGVAQLREAFTIRSARDTKALLDLIWVRYPWYFRPFTPFIFEDLVKRKVPEIVQSVQEQDFMNAELARFTMPVSVIWGTGDKLIGSAALQILSEKLPARRVYTIPESGHVPQLQAPAKLLEILQLALRELRE